MPFASLPIIISLELPSQSLHPPEYKKACISQVGCQSSNNILGTSYSVKYCVTRITLPGHPDLVETASQWVAVPLPA